MDIETAARRLRQRSPKRGKAEPSAAVALILCPQDRGAEVLLIRRAESANDRWSGHMAFPGGRRDPADADLRATAARETLEETGIDLSGARLLGELDDVEPLSRPVPPMLVRPFVFALPGRPRVTLGPEATAYHWALLGELASCAANVPVPVAGVERDVPAFLCGPHVVWGMTYRVLVEFLGVLPQS